MNEYFKDKVVIISGSSRGLGLALAKKLLQAGAKVVITARDQKRLSESEKILTQFGEVLAIAGDIKNKTDLEHLVSSTVIRFKRIDIIINNAGISMRGTFEHLSFDVIHHVLDTNLSGSILLTKVALPHLIQSQGQVYFISSIAGLLGLPQASIYCATKFALRGLCDSLRIELAPYHINVGIIYLGYTEHDHEKRLMGAKGELLMPDRPAHHTQAQAAEIITRAISKKKRKVVMTLLGKLAYLVSIVCPTLPEKIILYAQKKRWKLYQKMA